ncbi:MAG: Pvc16 family protein [Candidatus Limnocylindrales bacterium]
MIDEVVAYVRGEVRDWLEVADSEVIADGARALSSRDIAPGARITLLSAEPEAHYGSPELTSRRRQDAQTLVRLNLLLLISFEFESYETSLRHLSNTIRLFYERPVLSADHASSTNPFPADLGSLRVTQLSVGADFAALRNLWAAMGAPHSPSAVLRIEGLELQRTP